MKELAHIKASGTPAGIELVSAENMQEWVFTIAVLGDETVYKVRPDWCRVATNSSGKTLQLQNSV